MLSHHLLRQNRRGRHRAVTLIELMMVMTIIAIVSAIVFTYQRNSIARGKMQACRSNVFRISQAFQAYRMDPNHPFYPTLAKTLISTQNKNSTAVANWLPDLHCPAASSAEVASKLDSYYIESNGKDAFTVCCAGGSDRHRGMCSAGYPRYSSIVGKLEPTTL